MGFKTLVGRALIVSYFVITGISLIALTTEHQASLQTAYDTTNHYYSKLTNKPLPIDKNIIKANQQVILKGLGGCILLLSTLTLILNLKFSTILLIFMTIIGTLLLYPQGITSNNVAVVILKNLSMIGGLLLLLVNKVEEKVKLD